MDRIKVTFDLGGEVYSEDDLPRVIKVHMYHLMMYHIISYGTHPCIYVEIMKDLTPEIYDGIKSLDDYDLVSNIIDVHGGFTYMSDHIPNLENSSESIIIGWDYAHVGDMLYSKFYTSVGQKWTLEELENDAKKAIDDLLDYYDDTSADNEGIYI